MYCLVLSVHSLALNAFNKSFSQGGLFPRFKVYVLPSLPRLLSVNRLQRLQFFFFVNKIVSLRTRTIELNDRILISILLLCTFSQRLRLGNPGILFFSSDRLRNQKPVRVSVSKEREDYRT